MFWALIFLNLMAKRKRIKLDEAPVYPEDAEVKYFALIFRQETNGVVDCHTAFKLINYTQSIDVLCTWGCKDIFFVYAFPPAGFVISKPEDVLKLHTFEGWILEYQAQDGIFNLLVKASRDGVDFFWQMQRHYKNL